MNNSSLFKQAHTMAKSMHKQGESYSVTFGACLRLLKAEQAKAELVVIEQEVSTKENEASFWVYLAASLLLVLLMPVFNLNSYSILVGCSVCILGYVFEPFILAKLSSFQKPTHTHYVRFDMKNLSFTVNEYNKLKAQGENLSSFEPAIRMKDGSFKLTKKFNKKPLQRIEPVLF